MLLALLGVLLFVVGLYALRHILVTIAAGSPWSPWRSSSEHGWCSG